MKKPNRDHVERTLRPYDPESCPTPEKLAFDTKAAVKRKAKQFHNVRPYKCVCGRWHTTTNKLMAWRHADKANLEDSNNGET